MGWTVPSIGILHDYMLDECILINYMIQKFSTIIVV